MRASVIALGLLAVACSDTDFTPRWRVDRFRLLAVVADTPDARPGDTVTLTAVTADRPGVTSDVALVWLPCARVAIDNNTGARTCSDAAPTVVTGNPARVTLTEAPLDGAPWTVFGLACAGAPRFAGASLVPRCEGGEGEVFVRTIRQRGAVANHNPHIARITFDGAELREEVSGRVAPCALTDADEREERCAAHTLRVEFAEGSRESVVEVQSDGSTRTIPESLVTEFLVDGGDLAGAFRSDNDSEGGAASHANTFRAPAAGTVRVWVIARDGRGGFDVARRTLALGM